MKSPEEAMDDLRLRLAAMSQLKIFLFGLSQMSGLDIADLAGMAAKIAEVAEEDQEQKGTGDEQAI